MLNKIHNAMFKKGVMQDNVNLRGNVNNFSQDPNSN